MSDDNTTAEDTSGTTEEETEQSDTQSADQSAARDRTLSPDDRVGMDEIRAFEEQSTTAESASDTDSGSEPDTSSTTAADGEKETPSETSRQGPLKEIANSIDERKRRSDDTQTDELFQQKDIPEVDTDVVWEQLEQSEPIEQFEEEPEVRVVDKKTYCETCEYFSAPPEMHCTHDGTEIRKLVDFEHVEVVNCPIVKRNEELEQL